MAALVVALATGAAKRRPATTMLRAAQGAGLRSPLMLRISDGFSSIAIAIGLGF
jgi:hypothetical protein